MVNQQIILPIFIFLSLFSWAFSQRLHLWCEFKNKNGVKLMLVIQGEPRKLTDSERIFLENVAKQMGDLQYVQSTPRIQSSPKQN